MNLDDLLDSDFDPSLPGITRFQAATGALIEATDDLDLVLRLYSNQLTCLRDRDPDDIATVVVILFDRVAAKTVCEVGVPWSIFFDNWLQLLSLDLVEIVLEELLRRHPEPIRSQYRNEMHADHPDALRVSLDPNDENVAWFSVFGEHIGSAHRTRLIQPDFVR